MHKSYFTILLYSLFSPKTIDIFPDLYYNIPKEDTVLIVFTLLVMF